MTLDGFYTVHDVATALGTSYLSAYRFATSGALGEPTRVGTMRLYPRATAAPVIAARRRQRPK